ncbi:RluA family pseudouridine synthase [Candidatus Kapaibacterium sp.]
MHSDILKNSGIEIVYEDDRIVAINKPAGFLTLPDRYDRTSPSLIRVLESVYDKIFVVHRIDKETSGLILFAKDEDAHRFLNQQFMEHANKKIYHAVVRGSFSKEYLEVDIPILSNPTGKAKMIPSARGKYALTLIKPLEKYRLASLLECQIVTGRQHQIRVHCSTIGFPLLVDNIYSGVEEFYLSSIKRKFNLRKNESEVPIIKRLSLHSYSIEFEHPDDHKLSLTADYPKDFKVLIQILRKYA